MAESYSPTNKHYAKLATLMQINLWIALDGSSMAALTAASNALAGESAESGWARAAATVSQQTTTVADDTMRALKAFTGASSDTIYGAGLFSAATDGDMYAYHVWADAMPLISGDVVTETFNTQYKLGA